MTPRKAWAIYIALLFGTFVTIEASAFQIPALPSVTRHFGIPVSLSSLMLMLYFLAVAVFAPIMGRVGDVYGRKRILLFGLVVFAMSEFAAALAPNFLSFLVARFLQGFAVACILPSVFVYATHLFDDKQRGLALGILSFTMTLGGATGGALGGLLIDRFGWESIYWISGVLALGGLLPVYLIVPEIRGERINAAFDYKGALLLLITFGALLSLPTWASNIGTHSPLFWAILVCGLITLLVLIQHSRRTAAPVLDTKILSTKAFSLPLAIFWLHVLFTSSVLYALAFFMNNRPGGNASQFGLMTLFMFGSAMLSSPIAGRLCDRFEARRVSLFALIGTLGGSFLFLTIQIDSSLAHIAAICSLLGIMLGANTPASMKMAFGAIPPERIGVGTGMFSMFRDMASPTGSSLALAVFGTALADKASSALSRLIDGHALEADTLTALVRAATNRGPLPEALATQLQAAGIKTSELITAASAEALQGALTQVGYLLCVPILIALILATQLARTRQANAASALSPRVSAIKQQ